MPDPDELHLVDPRATPWTVMSWLARTAPGSIVVLGSSTERRWASALGLSPALEVSCPLGASLLAWRAVRRFKRRHGKAGVIRAWSIGAASAGVMAATGAAVHVTLSGPAPTHRAGAMAASAVLRRCAGVRFTGIMARDSWSAVPGWDRDHLVLMRVPTADPPLRERAEAIRREVRAQWGVDVQTRVIWAGSDIPCLGDAREFAYHVGVMAIAGRRVVGVLHPSMSALERAYRFTGRHAGAWRLILDDRSPEHIIPACDAALAASAWSRGSLDMARARGVACVEARSDRVSRMEINGRLLRAIDGSR